MRKLILKNIDLGASHTASRWQNWGSFPGLFDLIVQTYYRVGKKENSNHLQHFHSDIDKYIARLMRNGKKAIQITNINIKKGGYY